MNDQRVDDRRVMMPIKTSTRSRFQMVKGLLSLKTGEHCNSDETLTYLCEMFERATLLEAVHGERRD